MFILALFIIGIILLLVFLFLRWKIVEIFAEEENIIAPSPEGNSSSSFNPASYFTRDETNNLFITKSQAMETITEKANLVLNPITTTINHMVDTINEVPKSVYAGCMKLATTTGDKIKVYAMKMGESKYNKDDDTENVSIAKVHKEYIDKLKEENPNGFTIMKMHAERIYNGDIMKHDEMFNDFLKDFVPFKPSVAKYVKT